MTTESHTYVINPTDPLPVISLRRIGVIVRRTIVNEIAILEFIHCHCRIYSEAQWYVSFQFASVCIILML
jgi:hypothetical protein